MKKIKGIVAVVLSLGIAMAGSLTSYAAELPEQRSETSSIVEMMAEHAIEYVSHTYVLGEGVRLRRSPGTNGEIIGLLYESKSDWVELTGVEVVADGIFWKQASTSSIGQGGWISRDHLEIE